MGGYYDNSFVDDLEKKLKVPGGESYLKRVAITLGPELERTPEMYKSFGVYWWAIKQALLQYYGNKSAWFMKGYMDGLMLSRAWHGNLFRTVLAGLYYHDGQEYYSNDHEYTDDQGEDQPYTLFDENAGQ